MPGRDAQYAGEASYGSAPPPGFVYQPNGYKTPREQPRQSYNQNQDTASYNAPPEHPRQRGPPPRPRDERDYYGPRESYQNRGWGNNRDYYEPPRDYYYSRPYSPRPRSPYRRPYYDEDRGLLGNLLGLGHLSHYDHHYYDGDDRHH